MIKVRKRNAHTILCKALAGALSQRVECFGWPNNTGALRVGKRFIRFGLTGSGDWIGITTDGKLLAFECKTGKGKQTPGQKAFQSVVEAYGGRYYEVRSVDEAIAYLDNLNLTGSREHALFLCEVRRRFDSSVVKVKACRTNTKNLKNGRVA